MAQFQRQEQAQIFLVECTVKQLIKIKACSTIPVVTKLKKQTS
jgi:hypothetical protein